MRRRLLAVAAGLALVLSGCSAASHSFGSLEDTVGQPVPTTSSSVAAGSAHAITTKQVTKQKSIPFKKVTKKSSKYPKGSTQVTTKGKKGVETIVYDVTYTDGVETSRKVISDKTTTKPVNQVTTVGTYVAPQKLTGGNCDPNYSGCVPIASDVDCAGGSGNGPAYVQGPVRVIGSDIYGLDRDGDGIGCE